MNHLATILVLVLASSNASKFLQPIHQFQQELDSKESDSENSVYYDDGPGGRGEGGPSKLTALGGLQGWDSAPDPRMYVLTELEGPRIPGLPGGYSEADLRVKRKGPSLSIVNPLDVLRQRLLIEMARRQKAESMGKIQRNRELLSKVGKRSIAMQLTTDENTNEQERYKSPETATAVAEEERHNQQNEFDVVPTHRHGMPFQT